MNGYAILVGASREPIRALMLDRLKAEYAGCPGMDRTTKDAKLAKLHDELSQLEIQEELMIREMERNGMEIARRGDSTGLVLLAADEDLEA